MATRSVFRTFKKLMKNTVQSILSLRSVFYLGNNFECPCCCGHFKKFMPFGVVPRPNAKCPRCGLVERHRYFWIYYKERTNLFTEQLKVLHFAPERVFKKIFSSLPNLDYITADLSSPLADVKMDITDIKFKDNSFDMILCNDVLEHVPDDHKAMAELCRVLKRGGKAIIQAPIDKNRDKTYEDPSIVAPKEREKYFGRYDHVRVYGLDYKDRLESAGFQVKVINFIDELDEKTVTRCALNTDRDIYLCAKK